MNDHRLNRFRGGIFLTGFMAAGKSTVGRRLAGELEWDFIDLDTYIEEQEQKSIKEIFRVDGEEYFRDLERKYLIRLTPDLKNQVVALGGGALHNQHMVDHLKFNGILVWLKTPLETVLHRVQSEEQRPFLYTGDGQKKSKEMLMNDLKALYSGRIQWYEQAQITIDTANYSDETEISRDLIKKITMHV